MYPLVRELAGDGVPVTVTCRVRKISRQPYYRWLDCPVSDAELDEVWLANAIVDAHRDDPEFGYRFLADEVRAAGHVVSDRVVWRSSRFSTTSVSSDRGFAFDRGPTRTIWVR